MENNGLLLSVPADKATEAFIRALRPDIAFASVRGSTRRGRGSRRGGAAVKQGRVERHQGPAARRLHQRGRGVSKKTGDGGRGGSRQQGNSSDAPEPNAVS